MIPKELQPRDDDDVYRSTIKQVVTLAIYAPDAAGDGYHLVEVHTFDGWIPPLPKRGDSVHYWDGENGGRESWGWRTSLEIEYDTDGVVIIIHLNHKPPRKGGKR